MAQAAASSPTGTVLLTQKGYFYGTAPLPTAGSLEQQAVSVTKQLLSTCSKPEKVQLVITTNGVFIMATVADVLVTRISALVVDCISFAGMRGNDGAKSAKLGCFLLRVPATALVAEHSLGLIIEFKSQDQVKHVNLAFDDMTQTNLRNELYKIKQQQSSSSLASAGAGSSDLSAGARRTMSRRLSSVLEPLAITTTFGVELASVKGIFHGMMTIERPGGELSYNLCKSYMQMLVGSSKPPPKAFVKITEQGVVVTMRDNTTVVAKAAVKKCLSFVGLRRNDESRHAKFATFIISTAVPRQPDQFYCFLVEFKSEELLRQVSDAYKAMVENRVRLELFQLRQKEEGDLFGASSADAELLDTSVYADVGLGASSNSAGSSAMRAGFGQGPATPTIANAGRRVNFDDHVPPLSPSGLSASELQARTLGRRFSVSQV